MTNGHSRPIVPTRPRECATLVAEFAALGDFGQTRGVRRVSYIFHRLAADGQAWVPVDLRRTYHATPIGAPCRTPTGAA